MALAPLSDDVKNMSYTELKARVEVLTRRVNSLTQMKISIIGSDQKPSITITETNSTLSIPEATDCSSEVAALEAEIVALEAEIVALEQEIVDLGGDNEDLQLTLDAMRDVLADQFGVDYVLTGYITGTQNGVDWWASRTVGFTEQDGGEELGHSTVDTQTSAGFPLSQVPGMVIYLDGLTGPANGVTFNTVRPPNHTPGVPANFTVSGKLQTGPPGGFYFGPEDRFTWKYFGGA